MHKQVFLISCVKKKLTHPAKAREMYISPLFKFYLKYAVQHEPDQIYILSAKYGLLSLEEEISPYEKTLNQMPPDKIKEWASKVLKQINEVCSTEDSEFTILAGEKYRKYLLPNLKNCKIPLEGLGLGKQLQRLKLLTS